MLPPPQHVPRLAAALLACTLVTGVSARAVSGPPQVRDDLWITNGGIYCSVARGDTLYVGGGFTEIGPSTGGGVPIDAATGKAVIGFPKVTGYVYAIEPDGEGGWFIGGAFTAVGGLPRLNLAHLLVDRSVSPWQADADLPVLALARSGGTLYAGGLFQSVAGEPRKALAAIDATTGAVSSWAPDAYLCLACSPAVRALAIRDTTLIVGGGFLIIDGQERSCLAAFGLGSGRLTGWRPDPDWQVTALAVQDTTVYVGGEFTDIAGVQRPHLAAVGAVSAQATGWDPRPEVPINGDIPSIDAIVVTSKRVYVAGAFGGIGGRSIRFLAATDPVTGEVADWDPAPDNRVRAIAVSSSTIYLAGMFSHVGGQTRNFLGAVDAASGEATAWDPRANFWGDAIAVNGATVYAGGEFTSVGSMSRSCLAAFDLITGRPTSWNPRVDERVDAIVLQGGVIYAAGYFTHVAGQPRSHLAAIDATTGQLLDWNPSPDGYVGSLVGDGAGIYVGGWFESIAGQPRRFLVRLSASTGLPDDWSPQLSSGVSALTASSGRLYAGGYFRTVDGQPRGCGAAWKLGDGALTEWDARADAGIGSLQVGGGVVYAGGGFTMLGDKPRHGLGAVDDSLGYALPWDPDPRNDSVYDPSNADEIYLNGPTVYVGGGFTRIGGQPRARVAALSASSGLALDWDPGANNHVFMLTVHRGVAYLGGNFTAVGGEPRCGFAGFFAGSPPLSVGDPRPAAARLEPNRPNPFAASTAIRFRLARPDVVTLTVYDLAGRAVARLRDRVPYAAGLHEVRLDGGRLAHGVYLCQLRTSYTAETRRIVHLR